MHARLVWAQAARGGHAERRQAFLELLGGFAIERQGEDPLGGHPAADELHDALDHRSGLARPSGREDARRPLAVQHGGALAWVEARMWVAIQHRSRGGGVRRADVDGARRPPSQEQTDVLEVEPLPLVDRQTLSVKDRGRERERHAEGPAGRGQGVDEPAQHLTGTVA